MLGRGESLYSFSFRGRAHPVISGIAEHNSVNGKCTLLGVFAGEPDNEC